jgi:hypothetical protein
VSVGVGTGVPGRVVLCLQSNRCSTGTLATVSRHRKQKMAALVALEADILRIVEEEPIGGNIVPLQLAS